MPLYEYRCARCGATSEILVGVTAEEAKPVCASCGSARLQRKLSVINFSVAGGSARRAEPSACACGEGGCAASMEGAGTHGHSCGAGCACGH